MDKLLSFLNNVEEVTKKPEKYLSLQEDQAEEIKLLTKDLYDFTKQKEINKKKTTNILENLVITNLDEEQIWQQIELQNNSVYDRLVHDIAYLLAKKSNLKFPIKDETKEKVLPDISKQINVEEIKKNETKVKDKKKSKIQRTASSVVDDKFFKLHEMNQFLEKVENEKETYESEDEIDYFEEDFSNLNDSSDEQLHYNDFFDQPEEENINESSESSPEADCNEEHKTKRVTFLENDDLNSECNEQEDSEISEKCENNLYGSFDSNSSENSDNEHMKSNSIKIENNEKDAEGEEEEGKSYKNENDRIVKQPSTFEARQERLKTRIKTLEEEALREKPWQLKGEVGASNRPQNSLLEKYVEFDIASRPAPVLTEKSTLKLEDIIIQRIKDKAWDDVVRKIKPVENDVEYKKKLILEQEKSKLSLAQIYEQEYLKQLGDRNEGIDKPEVEPPEHQEIRIMMNKLFYKLDALSNFHFTPKQVQPEAKIVSNLPALNMEEVAPVATSDATLLAPEEVRPKPKGGLVGKSERTATDKKRERRQKKLKQKLKYKQIAAKAKLKVEKSDAKDLQTKKISQELLQKITKSGNIIQLEKNENGKYIKSSTAFFSKLQNETSSRIKKKDLDLKKIKLNKKVSNKKSNR